MAAQSNPPASFGYTWGFADNSRSDGQIVEISPNINYTVSDNVSIKPTFIVYYMPPSGHLLIDRRKPNGEIQSN